MASALERLKMLRAVAGARFEAVRDDFLRCLVSSEHRSAATVQLCMARRP